jgi:hypothetical protein
MFEEIKRQEELSNILSKIKKLEDKINYLEKLIKGLKQNKGISQ